MKHNRAGDALKPMAGRVESELTKSGCRAYGWAFDVEGLGLLHNECVEMQPNSTIKIYTAGAALLALDPQARLRTKLRITRPPDVNGASNGDLNLIASGDPLLAGEDLENMAEAAAGSGLLRVKGDLLIDISRHDGLTRVEGWESFFVPRFLGPLSAFALDQNRWRSDRAFVKSPVIFNAQRLRNLLEEKGVQTEGGIKIAKAKASGTNIAGVASPTVLEMVRTILKGSNNFVSEQIVKEMGAAKGGSTVGGLAVMSGVAADLGAQGPHLAVDGSGLSRRNRDTPMRQVTWLRAIDESWVGPMFVESLLVAGSEGNLSGRLKDPLTCGKVFAKTGTRPFGGTVNLAGFAETPSGRRMRFSFMISGAKSVAGGQRAIDQALIGALSACP
ncbi:MAG: D-alanyl-D-alanine carboxypeptidase/D-alanyl-D-alanine-endopeptidase [Actinomycetota bacterium]